MVYKLVTCFELIIESLNDLFAQNTFIAVREKAGLTHVCILRHIYYETITRYSTVMTL